MSDDGLIVALGLALVMSAMLLLITYYYDVERGKPQNKLAISSHSTIELEQYDPLIPPTFYINTAKTGSTVVGNVMARMALKYHMKSHPPFFGRGLPSSSSAVVNHVFLHPTWMPWMMCSFNDYISWTYRMVPNHLIVGSIRQPWVRHQSRYQRYLDMDNLALGNNLICREIGIHSLTGLRSFILDQKYLLSQWLSRTRSSMRMTGLIIWVDYDNLDKSLMVMRKWIGLSNLDEIYYNDKKKNSLKDYSSPGEAWLTQNNLDMELYSWSQELLDALIGNLYPQGISEELQEYQDLLEREYNGDRSDVLFLEDKEYQKLVLDI